MTERKNETEMYLYEYLTRNKNYSNTWQTKKVTNNKYVQSVLDNSSKKNTGNNGEPDLIYCNNSEKLLILLENKFSINDHKSEENVKNNPIKYAVDGIKHYLSFFLEDNLINSAKHLKNWRIIGIAFSGDIKDEYAKLIDTFYIINGKIEDASIHNILNEEDYLSLFDNIDLEKITAEISKSSQTINEKLRSTEIDNRPILMSALMISLLDKEINDFRNNYADFLSSTIADNIPLTVKKVLNNEGIDASKINVLTNRLSFLKDDQELRNNEKNILKDILDELKDNVIPLFSKKNNYDIIGKFYSEFLRYAGITNVKKGIVLTPQHITSLFADLIDISSKDVMNKITKLIDSSGLPDKENLKKNVKENQLLGFEINPTMYSLAISNMLFRGDGKSKIYSVDFFDEESDKILEDVMPTIGFINPPYGGKDTKKVPTKKEIQFLEKMLDNVSRYGIMIAPQSTYFTNEEIRDRILTKHTLKYIIHMPNDLFQPNAMTHTAIAVFETKNPHNNKDVIFYDLREDGFVLSKNKGRTDVYTKWDKISRELLDKIKYPENYSEDKYLLKKPIHKKDEWIIYAHMETDYDNLTENDFMQSIKSHVIFNTRKKLNLLNEDLDEISLLEILNSNISSSEDNNE